MANAPLVRVANVSKSYMIGKGVAHALRGVSLDIESGDFLALSGPSGSGKTTLLNLIGCIETPTSGQILLDGHDTSTLSVNALSDLRAAKMGFIFQSFNLLPVLSAFENVEYPLVARKLHAAERRKRVAEALERVGLSAVAAHKPLELSGGQRQRVAIARALVTEPRLILADEPTANLDHATGEQILDLMCAINREQRTTFVFSTHDAKIVERASRVVPIWDGLLVSSNP